MRRSWGFPRSEAQHLLAQLDPSTRCEDVLQCAELTAYKPCVCLDSVPCLMPRLLVLPAGMNYGSTQADAPGCVSRGLAPCLAAAPSAPRNNSPPWRLTFSAICLKQVWVSMPSMDLTDCLGRCSVMPRLSLEIMPSDSKAGSRSGSGSGSGGSCDGSSGQAPANGDGADKDLQSESGAAAAPAARACDACEPAPQQSGDVACHGQPPPSAAESAGAHSCGGEFGEQSHVSDAANAASDAEPGAVGVADVCRATSSSWGRWHAMLPQSWVG